MKQILCLLFGIGLVCSGIDSPSKIPVGSRIYVQPMDGFGSYIVAAINKKKVSVIVVADREKADF